MPVFCLEPITANLDDPTWRASLFKEACWIIARDQIDARYQLQGIALKMVDMAPGKNILYSPWLNPHIVECVEDIHPPASMKEGTVWTRSGKTYS